MIESFHYISTFTHSNIPNGRRSASIINSHEITAFRKNKINHRKSNGYFVASDGSGKEFGK